MQYPRVVVLSIPSRDAGFDGPLFHLWELFFAFFIAWITTRYLQAFPYETSLYHNYISWFVPSFQKLFPGFNK